MALYLNEEQRNKILAEATLDKVYEDYIDWKPKGKNKVGECPSCGQKKLNLTKIGSDYIAKCFGSGCDLATKNNGADFLQKFFKKEYPDNYLELADRFNINIETTSKKRKSKKLPFCDAQLKASGILKKDIKWEVSIDSDTKVSRLRYEKGTINQYGEILTSGDDMVLNYLDLSGKPMMFRPKTEKGKKPAKEKIYRRVRWSIPEQHMYNGKPVKYHTPKGSTVQLWFPQLLIKQYKKTAVTYDTLIITEGEKKADVMMAKGMLTVGISGIHNFNAYDSMPYQFQLIIEKFEVKNVVFLLDSDWEDLSTSNPDQIDQRPKSFARAVVKFRDYFHSFTNQDIYLRIFWGAHTDNHFKGIDDFIVGNQDFRDTIVDQFHTAINDRSGEADNLQLHKINLMPESKIYGFWHLNSVEDFISHYREELVAIRRFKFKGLQREYNEDTDELELVDKILPHERFWYQTKSKVQFTPDKTFFKHREFRFFLQAQKIGRIATMVVNHEVQNNWILAKINDRIIEEVTPEFIQDYTINFCEQMNLPHVEEMLLRAGETYMNEKKLNKSKFMDIVRHQDSPDYQYFFFKNVYWKIEADQIKEGNIKELPFHIWKENVIDFEPSLMKNDIFNLSREDKKWKLETSEEFHKSEMCRFMMNTSDYHWRNRFKLVENDEGIKRYVELPAEEKKPLTEDEKAINIQHFLSKVLASGYLLHKYIDQSNTKAIVTMDGIESEVGKSNGGTGKSIYSKTFEKIIKCFRINGKKSDIKSDPFLFDGVTERTGAIVFDDVRVNFDFENFFVTVTDGPEVNPKGKSKYQLPPKKVIINTNHALKGNDDSNDRRQYIIAFSDYYNRYRTPKTDFGHQLMIDWDDDQWNSYLNFKAKCVQHFLKYQLNYTLPSGDVARRKLRQEIGEGFLTWAQEKWIGDESEWINNPIYKTFAYDLFCKARKNDAKYIDERGFKKKLLQFVEYSKLDFNVTKKGKRYINNSKEYLLLSNEQFDASNLELIPNPYANM